MMGNCQAMEKLIDIFPTWKTGIIFSGLRTKGVPWSPVTSITDIDLSIEYFGNHSGDKHPSRLIDKLKVGTVLTNEEIGIITDVIYSMYSQKWDKLWATQNFEYNPIDNYNMVETMTGDETIKAYGRTDTRTDNLTNGKTGTETLTKDTTDTRTDNLTHGKTGTETLTKDTTDTRTDNLTHGKTGTETLTKDTTDTRTDNLTHGKTGTETRTDSLVETERPNLTGTVENKVFGFNSSLGVDADSQSTAQTGTKTTENGGTVENSYNLSETQTGTEATAHTGTDQTSYNLTETQTGTETTAHTGTDQTSYNVTETQTGTEATAHTGTDQTTYNLTEQNTGTQTNAAGGRDVETRNYQLTRRGNIGVTTTQQMIESERNLWLLWNFFNTVVFPDIDRVITIQIY